MSDPLTDPQSRIYAFIREYMQAEGRPPTNREIGQAVGIRSTGHVDHHLTMLERKGAITRVRGKSRGIRLPDSATHGVRIVGAIAAGLPLDQFPDTEQETLDLSSHAAGRVYVLRVKGDSMIDDHITSGDLVLIDPDAFVRDGDIIVATHLNATTESGAATLKRLYREREHERVRLQPANAAHHPIYVDATEWDREWQVQGKVVAVYRHC